MYNIQGLIIGIESVFFIKCYCLQAVNVSARPERRGVGRASSRLIAIEPEIAEHNRRLALLRQQMRRADEFMLLFPLSFFSCGRCRRFVATCRGAGSDVGAVHLAATYAMVMRHRAIEVYADLSEETLLRWIRLGGTSDGGGSKLAKTLYERDEEVRTLITATENSSRVHWHVFRSV